jgi:hypothetical protein
LNPRPIPYEGIALASLSYTGTGHLNFVPITAIRIANPVGVETDRERLMWDPLS